MNTSLYLKDLKIEMSFNPLVSIITPTYNHREYIGACIESVLSQTYTNWEQIIIDDGSIDGTEEVVLQYNDKRIKYFKQENIGIWKLSENYNKALEISKGELIAVLEGDDLWPSDKLEKQVPVFEDQDVVLSWGKCGIVNKYGKILYYTSVNIPWFEKSSRVKILKKLIQNNFIPACTAMCRKDALLCIGGFQQPDHYPSVDYPTWLKLSLSGYLKPINECSGFWRQHRNQITKTLDFEIANAYYSFINEFYHSLPYSYIKALHFTEKDLQKISCNRLANYYFMKGRLNLSEKRWNDARDAFLSAFKEGSISLKIMAIFGLGFSYFRLDFEWIIQIMHKPSLKEIY